MSLVRKAIASAVTGTLAWATAVTVSDPVNITSAEWIVLAGVAVGAFLTWLLPNGVPE